jgi:hypothetical protein
VLIDCSSVQYFKHIVGDCHGRDHIVVRFTTTYAINAYHHQSCEFEPRSWRGVLDQMHEVSQALFEISKNSPEL